MYAGTAAPLASKKKWEHSDGFLINIHKIIAIEGTKSRNTAADQSARVVPPRISNDPPPPSLSRSGGAYTGIP